MHIWTIKIGEPLPGENVRLMRTGMISRELAARGATVTWWVSTFSHNHPAKEYVGEPGEQRNVGNRFNLRFVHGPPYQNNVSLARILNHRALARDFRTQARALRKPDLIFCSYPPIEIADEATRYGAEFGIPVIVDVRDLWPEAFLDLTPLPRSLMRLALAPMFTSARRTLARATSLTAITEPFLQRSLALAGREPIAKDQVIHLAYEQISAPRTQQNQAMKFWHEHGLRFDGSQKIACFFGNLSNLPDLSTPLSALPFLSPPLDKSFKMVICGSGEKLSWLQKEAKQQPQLVVPGRVGQAEIQVLMDHAHLGLLIYPNRDDLLISYPNKFGEYLSGSLPILSTLDGLSGDLLRKQNIGATSPSGEPSKFARQIETMLGNAANYANMQANARRVYSERFDANQVYGELAERLLSVASQPMNSA